MGASNTNDPHVRLIPEPQSADQAWIDTLKPGEAAYMVPAPGAHISITHRPPLCRGAHDAMRRT
eukprot:12084653-Prorocentrum_lima.AAC.1